MLTAQGAGMEITRRLLIGVLNGIAKALAGRGLVDRYAPLLVRLFQYVYAELQRDHIRTVRIPLNCGLNVFARDIGVGLPLLVKGTYEPVETQLFLASLKAGDTVWDVGA